MSLASRTKSIRYALLCALLSLISVLSAQVEICNNGIDDDGDGLVDINDDDCLCPEIELISVIPNPSFEDRNCCPVNRSQLNCAAGWIQASEATTDLVHPCGWFGWDDYIPPQPFPDGEAVVGFADGRGGNNGRQFNWKEYSGACLLAPLEAGVLYRFEFDLGFVNRTLSPAIDISFFGTTSCDFLPFGVGEPDFGCPSNDPNWVKLASKNVDGFGGNQWIHTFLEVIPTEDITAIAIGPDCPAVDPGHNLALYYFMDNLILADAERFGRGISTTEHPCSSSASLAFPSEEGATYQWFMEGAALEGETGPELSRLYGEGSYRVQIMRDGTCELSEVFNFAIPFSERAVVEDICFGTTYQFGDRTLAESGFYEQMFVDRNGCDSSVSVALTVLEDIEEEVSAFIFQTEEFDYEGFTFDEEGLYDVLLESSIGCDSLVHLDLEIIDVYLPNIFSPNGDGFNDSFAPQLEAEVDSYEMTVFNRWGNVVHRGEEWYASSAPVGLYTYIVRFELDGRQSDLLFGDVTLVR